MFPNRVLNITCIVSTDDFIYFGSFWCLSCDRCHWLHCKCLINTYTRSVPPLLHLGGGKCLGFPSVPIFQSRSTPRIPRSQHKLIFTQQTGILNYKTLSPPPRQFFCIVTKFIYRETCICIHNVNQTSETKKNSLKRMLLFSTLDKIWSIV